ncbi:MAG: competence/damage-inducible protein A [Gammaproteobacteria bacterium]|nr:competence/damage-inducible protein A [Gammaproteobacteria bacterium]
MDDAFGIIVVGDEILNGRRRDRHLDGIGGLLRERGLAVAWLRILPDDPDYLAAELAHTMAESVPVFSCGGIGATPDDHTRQCAARAAGVGLELHPGAVELIEQRFGQDAYPHRIKMAELPVGSELIPNPYNRIPGFSINRHYFVPGFPDMAHPMAAWVLDTLYPNGGVTMRQCSLRVYGVPESELMELMQSLTSLYPQAKLFSLPRLGQGYEIELGFRGRGSLREPYAALVAALESRGIRFDIVEEAND